MLEVTGGCFCCNFDEFTDKVNKLSETLKPDIVLAEPVGSCTDLIATIFKPIQADFVKNFVMSPLSVIADPKRIKKLMMGKDSLFPSEINYLFKKQLEEADIIVLNKIDLLTRDEISEIKKFLKHEFKGTEVIAASAKYGTGIDDWVSLITGRIAPKKESLKIDYETYAAAESFLGWFNSTAVISSDSPLDMNKLMDHLIGCIKEKLLNAKCEIAHLKIYAISGDDFAKASLTGLYDDTDFNKKMESAASSANIIINARVSASPEILKPIILESLKSTAAIFGTALSDIEIQCFKPSRPKPKYRMQ